ncbi:DUF4293 domain-containing protein [Thermonema rossianum]|uniref:DUF4293 domain-containing protein n=1 Tax=Thermonema rossianum TaxID=55505 RepID=UPI0005710814|nr:DUF4293 domain-containing protein [Thermonema rossianum]
MIQRIQSVFLALAGISVLLLFYIPLWTKSSPQGDQEATLYLWKFVHIKGGEELSREIIYYFVPLALASAALSFGSLFSYTNRLKQIKLNAINSLVLMVLTLWSVYHVITNYEKLFLPQQRGHYYGFFVIIAAMLFITLANRFIRRDEKLVRSADRLR